MGGRAVAIALLVVSLGTGAAGAADPRELAAGFLERMRAASDAVERGEVRAAMVAALRPHGFRALEVLGTLLREETADPAPCQLAYALGELGQAYPEPAARLLLDTLPRPEAYQDVCISGGLARLGVAAYAPILQCAHEDALHPAYWCLITLAGQCAAVDNCWASTGLDVLDELDGEPSAARIHDLAGRWEAWWLEHRAHLTWNPQTFTLEEKP